MSALDEVLVQFAAELGMGAMDIDTGQPVVFRFERSGRLFLERRPGHVLVYFESARSPIDERQMVAALAACDMRHRRALPVRAGLSSDDRLVFGVVCDDSNMTLQGLHTALDLLMTLHADLANRAM